MKASHPNFVHMALALTLVTAVAAVSLGFVYEVTKEPIARARIEKQKKAIRAVAGQGDNDPLLDVYQSGSGLEVYPVMRDAHILAYAIKTYSEKGYSGRIELIVGVDTLGKVQGIRVLDHRETPGLGSKISSSDFQEQFVGQDLQSMDYRVRKDGGDVDAISGATISSRAFAEAVKKALVTKTDSP